MTRNSQAAGSILALSILAGSAIGVAYGEPSRGFVIGTVVGVVVCLAVWLRDRRR